MDIAPDENPLLKELLTGNDSYTELGAILGEYSHLLPSQKKVKSTAKYSKRWALTVNKVVVISILLGITTLIGIIVVFFL